MATRCDNWPSAYEYKSHVEDFISDNLSLGRVEGPRREPDLPPGFKCSPLGAFEKARSSKVRVIHDLSHPAGTSCNDGIDSKDCSVSYTSVDHAVSLLKQYNSNAPYMVKCDLSNAFNSVMVHPHDRHLLGFSWPNADGETLYYNMNVLPFGLKTAPRIFTEVVDFLEWIIQSKVPGKVIHYLDDWWACGDSYESALSTLNTIIDICEEAGFVIQESKTCLPTTRLEFLGIVIDSLSQTLSISDERLQEILSDLQSWMYKKSATKREILSLIGRLMFCSKVIRAGHLFIRRLIHLSKKPKKLHHRVRITPQARSDIMWWVTCIASHNGITMFPKQFDVWSAEIIFTDSSDIGLGICHRNSWSIMTFDGENSWMKSMTIAWRELYAVVVAIATYGPRMIGADLIMNIDNQAICYCINASKSKDPHLMNLIRSLYLYTSLYSITYRAIHISTHDNWGADALSRLDMARFRCYNPLADLYSTPIIPIICDY